MKAYWTLELLGGARLRGGKGEVVALERKTAALLAYVALEGPTPRRKLAGLLWPDAGDKGARNNLRQCLHKLKAHAGLVATGDPLGLGKGVVVDALGLKRCLENDAARLFERFPSAPELLANLDYDDCPDFCEWLLICRERLRTRWLDALDGRADALEAEGAYGAALSLVQALLNETPLSEVAYRRLMRLHSLQGDRGAALAVYERCCAVLARELGVEPLPETQQLAAAITHDGPLPRQPRLPQPLTPFVGREAELTAVAARLAEPACRLLTLTGIGGVGKTRLALASAARQSEAFRHGVFFVPLAALSSTQQLVFAVAQAIGFQFYRRQDPAAQLLAHLSEQAVLLVLDNFEQLRSEGVGFLSELLAHSSNLKLLVTSRERLRLPGEWVYDLGPMTLPESDDGLGASDAVALFCQCAARVAPERDLSEERPATYRLCRALGGLPLAIELASAWLWALSVSDIAARVEAELDFLTSDDDTLSARHRSLQAAFDASWSLLTEGERGSLAKLAVFRGGFTAEAAEAVAGASLADVLALMSRSLVSKAGEGRFALHELLRQYAAEKLSQAACEQVQANHGDYYAAQLQRYAEGLIGPQRQAALAALEPELANLHAAWRWAVEQRAEDTLTQMASGLFRLYEARHDYSDAAAAFDLALRAVSRDALAARLRLYRGVCALQLGKAEDAARDLGEALSAFQIAGERALAADAHIALGKLAVRRGTYAAAQGHFGQALEALEAVSEQRAIAACYNGLGVVADLQGEFAKATAHYRQSLLLSRELNDDDAQAATLTNLGIVAEAQGDYPEAAAHYHEALSISRRTGDRYSEAIALTNLGVLAEKQGAFDDAERYYRAGLKGFDKIGDKHSAATCLNNLALLERHRGHLQAAQTQLERALALRRAVGDSWGTASSLVNLGEVALECSEVDRAEAHLLEALHLCRRGGFIPQALRALMLLATANAARGEHEHAARWLTLVSEHPKSEQVTKDQAQAKLKTLPHRQRLPQGLSLERVLSELLGPFEAP